MAHFILATVLESFVIKKNVPTKQSRGFNPLKYTKKNPHPYCKLYITIMLYIYRRRRSNMKRLQIMPCKLRVRGKSGNPNVFRLGKDGKVHKLYAQILLLSLSFIYTDIHFLAFILVPSVTPPQNEIFRFIQCQFLLPLRLFRRTAHT